MRYPKLIAAGVLLAGMVGAGAQSMGEWKLGVGAQTSAANRDDYHIGAGAKAAVAMERQMGATDSRIGIRGDYLNYQAQNEATISSDINEYGIGLEALVGPAGRFFQPKVGGHVGYARQDAPGPDGDNLVDVGGDVMATYKLNPSIDLQATVTPLWLFDTDSEDWDYQTRGGVSIQLSLPPGA